MNSSNSAVSVLGVELIPATYDSLTELILWTSKNNQGSIAVDFANTHVVTLRRHNPAFALITECIDYILPDGMPLVWVMNLKGSALEDRVYGPTFTRKFLKNCPPGLTHYLVGGSPECGSRFRDRMLALNPELNFVGSYHGECSSSGVLEDDEAVLRDLREKRPDFIWVGLGTPKQYGWINRIKPALNHGVLLAVGFAFDVNAGMKSDAPAWMQRHGLTWLYRLLSEPQRLAGRYFKWNTLFIWYSFIDALFGKANASRVTSGKKANSNLKGSISPMPTDDAQSPSIHNQHQVSSRSRRSLRAFEMKMKIREFGLRMIDMISSDITDCRTGEKLGRGLLLGWGEHATLIGFPSFPPLVPMFLPQKRLTYWKSKIGFTVPPRPDYPRLANVDRPDDDMLTQQTLIHRDSPVVMNVLIIHEGGEAFKKLREWWQKVCPEENLWVAFGGTRKEFESLDYARKIFVDDPKLRRHDKQREKQSYTGIFNALKAIVREASPKYIYFCEYDHLPLLPDLNQMQVEMLNTEGADVMGHWLYKINGTGNYHELFHESDPDYTKSWAKVTKRDDASVILTMFGSGSLWTREAFLAVASHHQDIECYLEIYLPTLAHHLGFRVRNWNDQNHLISNLPSPNITIEEGRKRGCWTVHPVKNL